MKIDINKLTLEEKLKVVMGADFWTNYDLGGKIYKFVVSDGPVGLRQPVDRMVTEQNDCIKSVAYPSIQLLSQTWNRKLAYDMGSSIADDCIEQNVDVLLAPGVNIKRTPLCGRNFEYFSEDPVVAGLLSSEYIKGVQDKHVSTCLKHFCCNNSEYSRHWISSEVDERTLHEIYLLPFEIATKLASPNSVMCSYNLVNGVRMSENAQYIDILRKEFGFDGVMISDWSAVKDSVKSIMAGIDLEMPYDENNFKKSLEKAKRGEIDEKKLDECVKRIIAFAEKLERDKKLQKKERTIEERRAVAEEIATEGIVLLKNDGVLPLCGGKVLISGAPAKTRYFGGGSARVYEEKQPDTLETALKNEGVDAEYLDSISYTVCNQSAVWNEKNAVWKSALCDYTILCVGNPESCESEDRDRYTIKLSKEEVEAIHNFRRTSEKLIVVVYAGSAVDMAEWVDEADAIVWAGYGGEMGQNALAKVLSGRVNPSGKLTETFPLSLEEVPQEGCYRDETCVVYSDGLNVGYRYYDTFKKEVLFPFGFGLSYSNFAYGDFETEETEDGVRVSFSITNTSDIDGKEVAQVYVREITKEVYRPFKELKNFEKVFIKAGEKAKLSIDLSKRDFSYWSQVTKQWTFNHGIFEIMVGGSSRDIRLSKKIKF